MDCLRAPRYLAMAVPLRHTPASKSGRRAHRTSVKPSVHRCGLLRVSSSSQAGESRSCVAEKQGFADEEDYLKAGGSEVLFVEMQRSKSMEEHSKLADKLRPISIEDNILDLVVIGCGPAGLALAAESAKLGLNVGLIGPDLPFTNNYGVWMDEFEGLGYEGCIQHVWRDSLVYIDNDEPIMTGRAYGRVNRHLLHGELLRRCVESGVSYLSSKVERIMEAPNGHSLVACQHDIVVPCRLATVASGAASGKLLHYDVGSPAVNIQTAYGVEVEVENYPYDPSLMVFMDFRDYTTNKNAPLKDEYTTFLYTMPMSPTTIFFEETCLASKNAMPFDLLKRRLMSRLETMGIRINKTYEEEWSYIPLGGSLPNTEQRNFAFGAAAGMVHPATGYSIQRSLSEAPKFASIIANTLKRDQSKDLLIYRSIDNIALQAWNALWPQERKRQRAFFLFGLVLMTELDIEGIRPFFNTFFRLPKRLWQGFLSSNLSSAETMLFAVYLFAQAPYAMKMRLVKHLHSNFPGANMIKPYLPLQQYIR